MNDLFYNKYLKYKSKYLKLKGGNNYMITWSQEERNNIKRSNTNVRNVKNLILYVENIIKNIR